MAHKTCTDCVGTTDGMDGHAEEAAAALGGNINQHGGFYFQGQAYGHSKKLQVAVEYKIATSERLNNCVRLLICPQLQENVAWAIILSQNQE